VFVFVGFFSNKGKNALGSSQAASCDVYNVFCINDNSVRNGIHLVRIGIERLYGVLRPGTKCRSTQTRKGFTLLRGCPGAY
jgi:hypothetical protein